MSGHSHWHSIKHQKGIADAKRGKIFSKLSKMILIAAKQGGRDPESNPGLRLAVEKAKQANMPKDNIEKAIKKGVGELESERLEEFVFEAYGPEKTAIIIQGITDNKNRTLAEIKQILNQNQGKLANEGSVKWLFERKGVLIIDKSNQTLEDKENLELEAIEAGAEDTFWHNDLLDVFTKPEELEKIKKKLEEKQIIIESASLDWVAKEMIEINEKDKKACEKIFEELDENDAVQDIYSNLK